MKNKHFTIKARLGEQCIMPNQTGLDGLLEIGNNSGPILFGTGGDNAVHCLILPFFLKKTIRKDIKGRNCTANSDNSQNNDYLATDP